MSNSQNHSYTFVDLFSGAGGFSLGFFQEGFHDLLAIEMNVDAAETYRRNFPKSTIISKDIREVHSLEILERIKQSPDVVIASPPCESFTSANPRRLKKPWSRFYEDSQGDLVFHAIRLIGDLSPKYFVIENVVPIIDGEGRSILRDELQKIGFTKIHFNVISAEKYGCPSVRNRVFISNIHLGLKNVRKASVGDSLSGLPSPSLPNNISNHTYVHFTHRVKNKAYKIRKGQAAVYFRGATGEKKHWIKLDERLLSPTIMGKSRFIHPFEDRPLTPREHARLMTYPDTFEFVGSVSSIYNQIGESVPPILSRQIAKKIKLKLDDISRIE
ncbi:MAG: DNA cytosine methyltransferase [Candidatus Heimdallarchaeota archaeon]|nr:DNA cytosine methyltransferase [Candidatus Heimdallarchaeota archaeon]MCK4954569.1 DNA cytosine methyltransferase [Candidatus Heimdallarchaeota archaeon]